MFSKVKKLAVFLALFVYCFDFSPFVVVSTLVKTSILLPLRLQLLFPPYIIFRSIMRAQSHLLSINVQLGKQSETPFVSFF